MFRDSFILCTFSRTIVVGVPLGPATYPDMFFFPAGGTRPELCFMFYRAALNLIKKLLETPLTFMPLMPSEHIFPGQ